MLSQYSRPGVAISVAQQEALYCEYLQVQLQQALSDRRVNQAHSPSDSGALNPANQASAGVQNVAEPPLQPSMQPPRPATPVKASSNSNLSVTDFSTKPQANKTIDQPAVHLNRKNASLLGQLHLTNPPFAQQQYPPRFDLSHETRLRITPLLHNVTPPPNALMNPLSFIPRQQLVNPQIPVTPSFIPASTKTNLPFPKNA